MAGVRPDNDVNGHLEHYLLANGTPVMSRSGRFRLAFTPMHTVTSTHGPWALLGKADCN